MDKGGDISIRLDKLYDYIQMILLQGHLHNNIAQLNEAHKLIDEIHDGWQQIGKEVDQIDPQQVAANDESKSSL
jgi:flagellin-specific chaperone FliS